MMHVLYGCPICGKVGCGRTPDKNGDVFSRQHFRALGKRCRGDEATAIFIGDPQSEEFSRVMRMQIQEFSIPEPNTGCWLWLGNLQAGYGAIYVDNRRSLAHRISYESFKHKITDDRLVLHSCDNPACVNPDHLRLGTPAENNKDMIDRGRHKYGKRGKTLSYEAARAIRGKYIRHKRGRGVFVLAREFGVSPTAIKDVVNGRTWTEIEGKSK